MPAHSSQARAQPGSTPPRIAVIAALGLERACLDSAIRRQSNSPIDLYQSGVGRHSALQFAHTALDAGASALMSWGLAGGLEPGLSPGTVLLPARLLSCRDGALGTDGAWRRRLSEALAPAFEVSAGDLLEVERILEKPRHKAQAAKRSGAAAVDMESVALAEVATEAGVPFVALRVVADSLSDTLPPGVGQWVDEAGNRRLSAAVDAALRPSHWRSLIRLARGHRRARRTLIQLGRLLVPQAFLFHA